MIGIKVVTSSKSTFLLIGGLIGCAVDGITGGCYDLSPEFISVSLSKLDETSLNEFYIPEKAFDKLKQVQFLDEENKAEFVINISQED